MASINNLLAELDERTIAQRIGIPHDEARMRYSLTSNTVGSFEEFTRTISDYLNYHFTLCISHGGSLSASEASTRAKILLEREYRRHGGDIVNAYADGHEVLQGGMRKILDIIAEGLKAESVEAYVREVFDRYVAPNSWEQKVDIIRQFIAQCGVHLGSSIRTADAARFASSFKEIIESYVSALQRTSSIFRRL
jgi:hypothetical protein